jgi:alpha-D-ribose 1-methylphosphonate 5-phosphate C-P lyase
MKRILLLLILVIGLGTWMNHSAAQGVSVAKPVQPTDKITTVFFDNGSSDIIVNNLVEGRFLVQVFNLTGTEIIRQDSLQSTNVRIPGSKLRNGVYLVRITPTPSQSSATYKIVVR